MRDRRQGSKHRPRAIDLFSGCGGLTLGLKKAGFEVVGAVEIDELAVATYSENHKAVQVWTDDIRRVEPIELMEKLGLRPGDLDLLAGCPPCQGFSSIRTLRRGSVADDRNDLVFRFLDYVLALQPRAVMMENVPGLAADERMATLVSTLEAAGYTVQHRILDAADYGVPQRRRRLILLASRTGRIHFARRARLKPNVRTTLSKLPRPGRSGDAIHDVGETRSDAVKAIIARIPRDGGSRRDMGPEDQLACHIASGGFHDVYGRMAWDRVAPTITGGCINPSKGRFLHPSQNRSITLREAALLQTFPRRYRFKLTRGKYRVAEMIGNALPPEFIRRHAQMIRRHLLQHAESR
jgi:DNA (cytosine-5)-methyltransferase 1